MEHDQLRLLIYGKDHLDKEAAFDQKIKGIEEKYIKWFSERSHPKDPHDHDRLRMHTIEHFDCTRHGFGFTQTSDLPNYIRDECNAAFKEVYER
ncbi:hypothetical protein [Mucilaginibacter sp. SP1R1]|uniref:hypothetical protein n=1 Tax=Mucilaginibacter sp. SP1R1 TaxID=2723091 RepID=UPI0016158BFF|nr:hypothetical protein [Mucilaginibacter sp. SP1R1]MBB6149446.1 hypothetical protein [Mucilaginibacter sp. SP1R1]